MTEPAHKQIINIYETRGECGFLSNFAPYPIVLKDKKWPTSEHYFQAQKFAGTKHEEAIRLASSPMVAARMGRSRSRPLRPDWEKVKDSVMYDAVYAKYTQHEELQAMLLDTGEAQLVEHTKRDRYWGDGGNGSGKNRLGKILMKVRAKLRSG
ncbi:MAG: NADAR family protein [Anaerolineae bacterium]|nr:NADAR family protein [Anaerolineae bacterium]